MTEQRAAREKILRAANDQFCLQGYNATGLDGIIAAAGVAKGNFYHHFRTKEDLAVAVLDWHRDLAMQEIGPESPFFPAAHGWKRCWSLCGA